MFLGGFAAKCLPIISASTCVPCINNSSWNWTTLERKGTRWIHVETRISWHYNPVIGGMLQHFTLDSRHIDQSNMFKSHIILYFMHRVQYTAQLQVPDRVAQSLARNSTDERLPENAKHRLTEIKNCLRPGLLTNGLHHGPALFSQRPRPILTETLSTPQSRFNLLHAIHGLAQR